MQRRSRRANVFDRVAELNPLVQERRSSASKQGQGIPSDPVLFAQEWAKFARRCRIRSGRKIIPFDPYPYQIQLAESIARNYGTNVVKTRQLGLTEEVANIFLFKASLNPAYTAVVFSKGGEDTAKIAQRTQLMAAGHLSLEVANTREVKVKDGGRIFFRTSTPDAGRGLESVSDIFFDEWNFVRLAEQIYGAAVPSTEMVGDDARIIMVSTPNGKRFQFWEILSSYNGDRSILETCKQIRDGVIDPVQQWVDEQGWTKFIVHWKAHPVYSQRPNYLAEVKKKNKLADATLQREFNLSFDDAVGGGMIKLLWFPRYSVKPAKPFRVVQSWDTAQTVGQASSHWACTTWLDYPDRCYLIDCFARKMLYPDGERQVKLQAIAHNPDILLIENKSTGGVLIQQLNVDESWRRSIAKINPTQAKELRMSAVSYDMEVGQVHLPEEARWLARLENILSDYPGNIGGDEADTISQFLQWRRDNPIIVKHDDRPLVGQKRSAVQTLSNY